MIFAVSDSRVKLPKYTHRRGRLLASHMKQDMKKLLPIPLSVPSLFVHLVSSCPNYCLSLTGPPLFCLGLGYRVQCKPNQNPQSENSKPRLYRSEEATNVVKSGSVEMHHGYYPPS
jgi:hypothetical protein